MKHGQRRRGGVLRARHVPAGLARRRVRVRVPVQRRVQHPRPRRALRARQGTHYFRIHQAAEQFLYQQRPAVSLNAALGAEESRRLLQVLVQAVQEHHLRPTQEELCGSAAELLHLLLLDASVSLCGQLDAPPLLCALFKLKNPKVVLRTLPLICSITESVEKLSVPEHLLHRLYNAV